MKINNLQLQHVVKIFTIKIVLDYMCTNHLVLKYTYCLVCCYSESWLLWKLCHAIQGELPDPTGLLLTFGVSIATLWLRMLKKGYDDNLVPCQ